MSVNLDSSALVPAGPQAVSGPAFSQQGSFDWAAIGREMVQIPVAILGRLSSAGVDVLTVVVGQAICSKIPIGIHGEKALSDAMSRLKWCKGFGDVLWFGVGVEHILRVLVKTSEGASLVALCAALSEGHNVPTSSLIMYELAKLAGSPNELSPSFAQWQAMVKVCASAFCHTTLGLRIDKLLKLGGYTDDVKLCRWTGHPQDMAEIILALGDVVTGKLVEVNVRGGPACSWVAAYADFVLGLRVAVRGDDHQALSINFDGSIRKAQVNVTFYRQAFRGDETPSHGITCVSRTFFLRGGDVFIQQYFHGLGYVTADCAANEPFLGGRVNRNTMLCETFGRDAEDLLRQTPESSPDESKPSSDCTHTLSLNEVSNLNDAFVGFFVAGAAFYTCLTTESTRYANVQDFILSATTRLPELTPLKGKLSQVASQLNLSEMSSRELCAGYFHARKALTIRCRCPEHNVRIFSFEVQRRSQFCLARIAEIYLSMSYLTGRLHLEVPLNPRRHGILRLYEDMRAFPADANERLPQGVIRDENRIRSQIMCDSGDTDLRFLFSTYIALFSGEPPPLSLGTSASAISDGKICCFIDTVRELSDCYEQASVVHVGAGSIQVGYRLHYTVFDGQKDYTDYTQHGYSAQQAENLHYDEISTRLAQDTTSPGLQVTSVVHDSVHLAFWYRFSPQSASQPGEILISPGSFVKHLLADAVRFKSQVRRKAESAGPSAGDDIGGIVQVGDLSEEDLSNEELIDKGLNNHNFNIIAAHGEGSLPPRYWNDNAIIVRPHCGNKLGRCAALTTSLPPVALLNSAEDLEAFLRVFGNAKAILGDLKGPWTLI